MGTEIRVELSEDGSDPERVDELTRRVRGELLELDVDGVVRAPGDEPPVGARALDAAVIGALLVQFGTPDALGDVLGFLRRWLGDRDSGRAVSISMGADHIELAAATPDQQERLVSLFVERNTPRS